MTETTIKYVMKVSAKIIFDNEFTYNGMVSQCLPIEEYINKAKFYMSEYKFTTAKIVDAGINNILVEMKNS